MSYTTSATSVTFQPSSGMQSKISHKTTIIYPHLVTHFSCRHWALLHKGVLKFDKTTTIAINYSLGDWPSPLKSLRLDCGGMSVNLDGIATFPNKCTPTKFAGRGMPTFYTLPAMKQNVNEIRRAELIYRPTTRTSTRAV